jgi:2-hydroxychromene-2-carboxylate isomerase
LEDLEALQDILPSVELDAEHLEERMNDPEVKNQRRLNTEHSIEKGVTGVPSVVYRDEIFWGQDRLCSLAARLSIKDPQGPTKLNVEKNRKAQL